MNLTEILVVALLLSAALTAATIGLLIFPIRRFELRVWRFLRLGKLRRRLSNRRGADEPLHFKTTVDTAQKNILWHLFFTGLFCWQLACAVFLEDRWWRPLTLPLVVISVAYFLGSLVQRQKIAIVRLRSARIRKPDADQTADGTEDQEPVRHGGSRQTRMS